MNRLSSITMWIAIWLVASPTYMSAVWIRAPYEIWSHVGPHHPKDHPGHYPFVSSTTFRSICDHVIDQVEGFDADVVKTGDTIYLNCWYLPWFVTYIHDKIRVPYILVTCDTNTWLPLPSLKSLLHDPKCAAWFGRHMIFSGYPKVFQIPMGEDLLFFDRTTASTDVLLKSVLTKSNEKKHLLYMNFFPREKGGRNHIAKLFGNVPYCFSRNNQEVWEKIDLGSFYEEMASSKFILSPWGVEFEAIRTWEAVVLGAIPIVEHSFLDPLYEDLPILLIHQWEEINETFLHKKYEELKRRPIEKAYFYYWKNLIKEVQTKVRNGTFHPENLTFSPQDLEALSSLIKPELPCIYRGSLTQSRPAQVANLFNTKIYLYDRWFDPLLSNGINMDIQNEAQYNEFIGKLNQSCILFLDLTLHRHSLLRNDHVLSTDYELIQHRLKQDIYELSTQLKPGSFIVGNMNRDDYVQEVLNQISHETQLKIQKTGDFWLIPIN